MDIQKIQNSNVITLRSVYKTIRNEARSLMSSQYTASDFDKDVLREMELQELDFSPANMVICAIDVKNAIVMQDWVEEAKS
jgi:hypothetical protein